MATKVGVDATMVVATIIGNIKVTMLATMVYPIKFVPSLDIPPTIASRGTIDLLLHPRYKPMQQ
jgi:DMSO reductase anchor subunit